MHHDEEERGKEGRRGKWEGGKRKEGIGKIENIERLDKKDKT